MDQGLVLIVPSRRWLSLGNRNFNSYPSNHVSPCLVYNSWKLCWLNKSKCSCLDSVGILALWIIRIGWCSSSRWRRIGNQDTRMGFCTVIFPLECEGWNEGFYFYFFFPLNFFFLMFRRLWEALLTFYGVVIGNGKMALYIYIIYINIYYTYSPILYFSYHPHRSWQELLWLKGFWVLIKTLFMTVFIISLSCIL